MEVIPSFTVKFRLVEPFMNYYFTNVHISRYFSIQNSWTLVFAIVERKSS